MILVNVDSLSASELRSIAVQEGFADADELSREEIISLLEEKYEEEDDKALQEGEPNSRYMSGLTDYRDSGSSVEALPGVEALPESYPDTEIHLIKKSCSWLYAFWFVSQNDSDRLQDAGGSLSLSVTIENSGRHEEYDIPVSFTDTEWNVGIPYGRGFCRVALTGIYPDGSRTVLAVSDPEDLIDSYWLSHREEMMFSDSLYRVYLTLISTKEGGLPGNPVLREIIEMFRKEDGADE